MRKLLVALAVLQCQGPLVIAQTLSCGPGQLHLLKSTTLAYRRLGVNLYDNRYRFFYTVTVECGNANSVNPLYIYDPQHPQSAYALVSWQQDSSKNIAGVKDPCLAFPEPPCYSVFYYHTDTLLPNNLFGYTASVLNCCRPEYTNLYTDTNSIFRTENPPMSGSLNTPCTPDAGLNIVYNGLSSAVRIRPINTPDDINSSPQFVAEDTILFVCRDSLFSSNVSAVDPDGDSVAYHFARPASFDIHWNCYSGCTYTMLPEPPLQLLYYGPGYSVDAPAGKGFALDPLTGWLRGTIHDTGTYVIPVSALEYRKGVLLDSVTKDIMIRVFDCSLLPPPKAITSALENNCNDLTIQFPNNSTPDYHGYNWLRTFRWDFGDGDTSSAVSPVHTYADTGTYTARLIIFPGLYCADTAYSKVIVYPRVKADFTHSDSCSGAPVPFVNQSLSTSAPISSTTWKVYLEDKVIDSSHAYNLSYSFPSAPQTYAVVLRIANKKGCADADSQFVNIYHSPYPLAFHDTILAKGESLPLHADDGNFGLNAIYQWTPPTGLSDPGIADPVLNSQTEGVWDVTITNEYGCTLKDSVHVKYYTGPDIYIPNAFTPNGDGRNDVLRPVVVGIASSYHFRVFSRSGQMVFQSNRSGEGWDGKINGRPAGTGTYVWEASGVDYRGKSVLRKGTAELIR